MPPRPEPRPEPVLFGKLPDRADFVRRGAPSPALDALDELVQRALRTGPKPRTGPLYRMVYAPPSGPDALVGGLSLSRDRVGRSYPLVVARTAPRDALDPHAAASWPLRWADVLDDAVATVYGAIERGASLDRVAAHIAEMPPLAPPSGPAPRVDAHVRAAASLPASWLWARLWGDPDPRRPAAILRQLASSPRRPLTYGLRFPLPPAAPDFGPADGAAFWLAVCWHLLATPRHPPTLFWTDGPHDGALTVFFGGLTHRALRPLLGGHPDPDTVVRMDLVPEATVRRALGALPHALARVLRDPRASVADVLAHLHAF